MATQPGADGQTAGKLAARWIRSGTTTGVTEPGTVIGPLRIEGGRVVAEDDQPNETQEDAEYWLIDEDTESANWIKYAAPPQPAELGLPDDATLDDIIAYLQENDLEDTPIYDSALRWKTYEITGQLPDVV